MRDGCIKALVYDKDKKVLYKKQVGRVGEKVIKQDD